MRNSTTFIASPYHVAKTMSRLIARIRDRGIRILARADVTPATAKVNPRVRREEVLLLAAPITSAAGSSGVSLSPLLRVCVFQDSLEQCWISYTRVTQLLPGADPLEFWRPFSVICAPPQRLQ
jgi:uncharacterized protein (DUF302 family)